MLMLTRDIFYKKELWVLFMVSISRDVFIKNLPTTVHFCSIFETNTFFSCWNNSNTIYRILLHYCFRVSFRLKRRKRMQVFSKTPLFLLCTPFMLITRRLHPLDPGGCILLECLLLRNNNKNNLLRSHF